MERSPRDQLQELLASIDTESVDSATLSLPADVLELHVHGLGAIDMPIGAASAEQLKSVARPAHVGKGEETLHDPSVRDTWQLTPQQVTLGGDRWEGELTGALKQLGAALGLPKSTHLRTELHSMLVYGEGQFFAPHQDSEKHDDMVATLVVSLPSEHSGGELVVDDRGSAKHYEGSPNELGLALFYADRRHEVLPVRSGHRVTLTFNVLMETGPLSAPTQLVAQASSRLREYFSTPVPATFGREFSVPKRLGVLLDHEYSQHGLVPERLKGADAERVAVMTAAAEQANCEFALALAEIEETWDAVPSMDFYEYDYDEEDDDFGFDDVDGELNELIDDSIVLTWWTDQGTPGTIQLPLDSEVEVCAVTPTVALPPYESEFEGYVGNYGNTVDRWYRRAALIVWPIEHGFSTRAKAAPQWALSTIQGSLAAGHVDQARSQATSLLSTDFSPAATQMPAVLEIAVELNDTELAMTLLRPFTVEALAAHDATKLAQATALYPPSFWNELFEVWDRRYSPVFDNRLQWIEHTLEPLCAELRQANAANFADRLVAWMREWISKTIESVTRYQNVYMRHERLSELGPATAAILTSASDHQANNIVGELQSFGNVLLPLFVDMLRAHSVPVTDSLCEVACTAQQQLTEFLARPQRAADDWSISWTSPGAEDEDRLEHFLNASDERIFEWPLAGPRRQVIHSAIETAGLPVRHETRRQGRPYTLVLEKTTELFTREAQLRNRAERDLAWISERFA